MGTISKEFGDAWNATAFRYDGSNAVFGAENRFYRQGYSLGYTRGRFDAVGLLEGGADASTDPGGTAGRPGVGLLQTSWHFSPAASLYARYDLTYDAFAGRQTAAILSLVPRPTRNTRFTIEGSRDSDHTYEMATGLLFAY